MLQGIYDLKDKIETAMIFLWNLAYYDMIDMEIRNYLKGENRITSKRIIYRSKCMESKSF